MNHPRDWIIAAFILAVIVGASAMWMADRRMKQQAAAESIEAVRVSLTPYERDRREAIEKINRVYGGGK